MEAVESAITVIFCIVVAFSMGVYLIRWIRLELFLRKNDACNAETSGAVAYFKDPNADYLPQGRASSSVHYITFHTDTGDIVTLCMGPRDYYAIEEGARGILTWQGQRFWKFEQDRV